MKGLLEFDRQVTQAYQGGLFDVTLDNNAAMLAKVCGHECCHGLRIALGDRVRVGVSPYDPHAWADCLALSPRVRSRLSMSHVGTQSLAKAQGAHHGEPSEYNAPGSQLCSLTCECSTAAPTGGPMISDAEHLERRLWQYLSHEGGAARVAPYRESCNGARSGARQGTGGRWQLQAPRWSSRQEYPLLHTASGVRMQGATQEGTTWAS
jgi:translation initiation factor IF-1